MTGHELIEQAPCGMLSADADGRILRVNQALVDWTGVERERLESGALTVTDLLAVGGRIYFETHVRPLLQMQGTVREIAVDVVHADGRRLPVLVNAVLRRGEDGAPQALQMTLLDATQRRAYERELLAARDAERAARERAEDLHAQLRAANADLERLAHVDALTGLENRRALERHLRRCAARARRRGTPFSVALLDIDRFKDVNDVHGHGAGDAVLRAVAKRLRESLRQEDVAGRWGGEEFLVIAPDTDAGGAAALSERARSCIGAAPVRYRGRVIDVTVSIGVAAWPAPSVEELVRRADDALYAAKAAGRNRISA